MDILLGQYKGLEAAIPMINYTEEDIQAQLHALLSGNPVRELKNGPVDNGDTAVIDYEGFKDDVPFEGGKAGNTHLSLVLVLLFQASRSRL